MHVDDRGPGLRRTRRDVGAVAVEVNSASPPTAASGPATAVFAPDVARAV
jgi:hypothetical protein